MPGTGPAFGWADNSTPYITAANLEAMRDGRLSHRVDTPENHGAKRDGRLLTDATVNSSGVLNSTSAPFVVGDVGKSVLIQNPSTGATISTTISAYTNASNVTLASNPGALTTTIALYGTDDTTAIKAAINAADAAAITDGSYYYEIWFSAGIYMVAGSFVTGATKGNAQIPIPLHADTGMKMTCVLRGTGENAGLLHWNQTVPQLGGAYLVSTRTDGTLDGTNGPASVIGGPTQQQGYGDQGGSGNTFSNVYPVIDGLGICLPLNPTVSGVDLYGCAVANVKNLAVMTFTTHALGIDTTQITHSWQFGLNMPSNNNNAIALIGHLTAWGCYVGVYVNEHTHAQYITAVICVAGVEVGYGGANLAHHAVIQVANVEACQVGLGAVGAAGPAWIQCHLLDVENISFTIINDPFDVLYGDVVVHTSSPPLPNGTPGVRSAANLSVYDITALHGWTAPSVPASGSSPAIVYRDATVSITAGASTCTVAVAGVTQLVIPSAGVAAVTVPRGQTITLTYSSAPTWKWVLQ